MAFVLLELGIIYCCG